ALDRQVFEDHVHHDIEQRVELVALQKRFRDLHEDLKNLFARDRRLDFARLRNRARGGGRLRELAELESEFGIEIGNAADDGARRIVEHRLSGEVDRGERFEIELNGADENLVAWSDLRFGDQISVHLHAVRRFEIDDPERFVAHFEL